MNQGYLGSYRKRLNFLKLKEGQGSLWLLKYFKEQIQKPTKGVRQKWNWNKSIFRSTNLRKFATCRHALNETLECFKLQRNYPR